MKATELEDYSTLVTKDYLDAKLGEFRVEILQEFKQLRHELHQTHTEMFRWTMGMFAGLYATNIAMFIGLYTILK